MENEIYPIYWQGRIYSEFEVARLFKENYKSSKDLQHDGSVVVRESIRVYPNGKTVAGK